MTLSSQQGVEQQSMDEAEGTLADLVDNEALSDVALKGSDGVVVYANRGNLAARSAVFRSMLFGEFLESRSAEVQCIKYEGAVIRCIVEYCCTSKVQILSNTDPDEASIRRAVLLASAANYYALPTLRQKVQIWLAISIDKHPLFAWFVLEMRSSDEEISDAIVSHATNIARRKLSDILDTGVVQNLSSAAIESVLKDEKMCCGEMTKFLLLQTWAEKGNEERKTAAGRLSAHLHLVFIKPSDLVRKIKPSGLVTDTRINEAYMQQALMAEQEGNASFARKVRNADAAWEGSKSKTFTLQDSDGRCKTDNLDCLPLESGIHTWRIKVKRLGAGGPIGLGVLSTAIHKIDRSSGISVQGGWCYWSLLGTLFRPDARCEESTRGHPFSEGDTVTLTLDLTENGTLSAKVGNGEYKKLFYDMFIDPRGEDRGAFVPAVSLNEQSNGAEVVFVDMTSKY